MDKNALGVNETGYGSYFNYVFYEDLGISNGKLSSSPNI